MMNQLIHKKRRINDLEETRLCRFLGTGSYGKVYESRGSDLVPSATKVLSFPNVSEGLDCFIRETLILKAAYPDRFLKIHTRDTALAFTTPLYEESVQIFNKHLPIPEVHLQLLAKSLITAVEGFHSIGIAHLDLKPENILMDWVTTKDGCSKCLNLRVIDFGLSTMQQRSVDHNVITLWWRAPEILLEVIDYDTRAADVWSLGMILLQWTTGGEPLLSGSTTDLSALRKIQMHFPIDASVYTSPKSIALLKKSAPHRAFDPFDGVGDDDLIDLLSQMLDTNPQTRATLNYCLNHPFFKTAFPSTSRCKLWIREVYCDRSTKSPNTDMGTLLSPIVSPQLDAGEDACNLIFDTYRIASPSTICLAKIISKACGNAKEHTQAILSIASSLSSSTFIPCDPVHHASMFTVLFALTQSSQHMRGVAFEHMNLQKR